MVQEWRELEVRGFEGTCGAIYPLKMIWAIGYRNCQILKVQFQYFLAELKFCVLDLKQTFF